MAHPFKKFNEKDAGKARAKHLTKDYASGGKVEGFARGGAAKNKGTNINIVIAPQGTPPAPGGARPVPVPMPTGGPPPMPPGGPSGPGPGMAPPPGMPMMQRGGKVKMTAGAETGKGRLEKARALKDK